MFDPVVWWYGRSSRWKGSAMGQVLHGSARTTEAVRRAMQLRQESVRALAKRYGISPTTVQKWRKRGRPRATPDGAEGGSLDRADAGGGGDHRRLPPAHAAAARRLPLRPAAHHPAPDPLEPASLPAAARHQSAARDRRRQAQRRSASRPIRSATSTSTSPRSAPKRASCSLFVAIDRTSKFAFVRLVESAGKMRTAAPSSCAS